MKRIVVTAVSLGVLTIGLYGQSNPFLGRWDFDVPTHNGVGANWLGISEQNGHLDIWFQPTGGNVYQVNDYKLDGSHLSMTVAKAEGNRPAMIWDLTAENGKLVGTQKTGDQTTSLTGVRAPELNRPMPKAWRNPEALFNGRNLDGWEPIGDPAKNHWVVQNGDLVNLERGDNLRTMRTFNDFKLHFEVNCPEGGNSGFYLRGRYELQIEYEPAGENPPNRAIGSIYGRIAPSTQLPRKSGQWETFDVTLVGRTVTVVRDGVMTIDHKVVDGITGGALNADEGEPGPFYIQGDHTGGIRFRNITVQLPE
jgi:hypothetical protein